MAHRTHMDAARAALSQPSWLPAAVPAQAPLSPPLPLTTPLASPLVSRAPHAARGRAAKPGKPGPRGPGRGRSASDADRDADGVEAAAEEPAAGVAQSVREDEAAAPQPDVLVSRAARAALVELSGYGDGSVTLLRLAPGERGVIGRMGEDLALQLGYDQWVSARHAQIWEEDGAWWLEDLRSRNGTILQRTQTQLAPNSPVRLVMGDIFRVGHTDLQLTDDPQVMRSESQGA